MILTPETKGFHARSFPIGQPFLRRFFLVVENPWMLRVTTFCVLIATLLDSRRPHANTLTQL